MIYSDWDDLGRIVINQSIEYKGIFYFTSDQMQGARCAREQAENSAKPDAARDEGKTGNNFNTVKTGEKLTTITNNIQAPRSGLDPRIKCNLLTLRVCHNMKQSPASGAMFTQCGQCVDTA